MHTRRHEDRSGGRGKGGMRAKKPLLWFLLEGAGEAG